MRKIYASSLFLVFALFSCSLSKAQIVGTNMFLQGRYLEIGMTPNASFGACSSPASYHSHTATGGTPGGALSEVYDYGHDGWAVGTPAYMGDYTYPGSPFEGWELQVGTGRTQAFQNCGGTMTSSGGGTLVGAPGLTGYSNSGGVIKGNWIGTAAGGTISVKQETRVDTNASWVVITTKFYNTTAATTPAIYYMRSCDPDNNESWDGITAFTTNNYIDYQHLGGDPVNRVQVRATSSYPSPADQYPLALCTKDCRAVACIYSSWPLTVTQDLAAIWNMTYGVASYTFAPTGHAPSPWTQDISIALVYNLGTLCPHDSTFISYAYSFLVTNPGNPDNGKSNVDSAFPEPNIVVNGVPANPPTAPSAIYDTFNACLYPGMTTLPIDLSFASTGVWTWSTWSWSPGTGLTSTTGTTNTINLTALPPSITYTITGTAYNSCGGTATSTCGTRVIYLTVLTCNGATVNSPCVGDPLIFNAPGDSTGATYIWYGPAPSTTIVGTTQSFTISPSTMGNAGLYTVVKTVGLVHDTSTTVATIHPIMPITGTTSICLGGTSTLTDGIPGGTWSSSNGAVATIDPTGLVTSHTVGTTVITYTNTWGCTTTTTVNIFILTPITGTLVLCQGSTTTLHNSATGGTWTSGNTSVATVGSLSGIVTGVSGGTSVITYTTGGGCFTTATVTVNPLPGPISGPTEVCQFLSITLTDASPGGTWASNPYTIATITSGGVVTGVSSGVATITYTLPTGCLVTRPVTIRPKPGNPVVVPPTYCQFAFAGPLTATPVTGLLWYGPGITTGSTLAPSPSTSVPGVTNYYVTETNSYGCVSDSAADPVTIIALPGAPVTHDARYCRYSPTLPLNDEVDSLPGSHLNWYTTPTGGLAIDSTPKPPSDIVTYPAGTTWYVSQTTNGCEGPRTAVNVKIVYLPSFTIDVNKNWVCAHDSLTFSYNGPTLDSGSFYWSLPPGATAVNGTSVTDPVISVKFDSVYGPHVLTLTVGELNNMCTTSDTISIRVVPPPHSHCHMKPDICLGDTVLLGISDRSADAEVFSWFIDGAGLAVSPKVNIVAANSNSGGPFSLSWNDSGTHVITILCATHEGCRSEPTYDTVDVHGKPVSDFDIDTKTTGVLCLEDSLLFTAHHKDQNCNYLWEPEHCFKNNGKWMIWGRVEQGRTDITLTISDPYGCKSSTQHQLSPDACCTVLLPTAFSPNGDGVNDKYRPVFNGYHNFHSFRIVNRWGQTVFESANSNPEWDGNFNGVPQDIGVYYYYIKYDCGGNTLEQKGDCTLVR